MTKEHNEKSHSRHWPLCPNVNLRPLEYETGVLACLSKSQENIFDKVIYKRSQKYSIDEEPDLT
jgi:hypothetical protein